MKSFLDHIIEDIASNNDLTALRRHCYVFPSKRACLFFEDKLMKRFSDKVFWSPKILSIEEFVHERSNKQIPDEISLLFKLFEAFRKHDPKLAFERFYPWGQIILSDFDELDKYLVDPDKVYSSLKEVAAVDQLFGDSEEVRHAIKQFQKIFSSRSTALANRFIQNWEHIRRTYHDFNDLLESDNQSYSGRAFRELAEGLLAGNAEIPYTQVVFAGFNALSISEETLFENLLTKGLGTVYFDADPLYLNNANDEAGHFLRGYKKRWPYSNVKWIESDLTTQKKVISVIGGTQLVGQARVAGHLLRKLITPGGVDLDNTAIILGDERLLMPVLYALPPEVDRVNVTMGYPFRNTTLFAFITLVFRLHLDARTQKDEVIFRSSQVISILKNTLIGPMYPESARSVTQDIRRGRLRSVKLSFLVSRIKEKELLNLFSRRDSPEDLADAISSFLSSVFYFLKERNPDESDREIVYFAMKYLRRFTDNILRFSKNEKPGMELFYKLFLEVLRTARVPFTGEPLSGLQIMGFLEARALDMENVIMVGVNEGKIPANRSSESYLPFAVRKAFQMPTNEEHEAIYSYHFKRAMQRANNISIIYDTEVAIDGSGEKSRFIQQLQYLADTEAVTFSVERTVYRNPVRSLNVMAKPVTITKDAEVLDLLHRKYAFNGSEPRLISPTKLSTYLDCKLRFYLKHLAEIPEEEPAEDKIDPRVFGNIIHKLLEFLYKPFEGRTIQKSDLKEMAQPDNLETALAGILEQERIIGKNRKLEGKDILLKSIMSRLIKKIVEQDMRLAPFEVLGIEKRVVKKTRVDENTEVLLGGYVDRLDRVGQNGQSVTRVIDYKTGKVDMVPPTRAKLHPAELYLQPYFADGKFRPGFQAYFYTSIIESLDPENDRFKAGILGMREVNKGIRFLRDNEVIDGSILDSFTGKISEILKEIFDPATPFDQTQDLSKCRLCSYKAICQR